MALNDAPQTRDVGISSSHIIGIVCKRVIDLTQCNFVVLSEGYEHANSKKKEVGPDSTVLGAFFYFWHFWPSVEISYFLIFVCDYMWQTQLMNKNSQK